MPTMARRQNSQLCLAAWAGCDHLWKECTRWASSRVARVSAAMVAAAKLSIAHSVARKLSYIRLTTNTRAARSFRLGESAKALLLLNQLALGAGSIVAHVGAAVQAAAKQASADFAARRN